MEDSKTYRRIQKFPLQDDEKKDLYRLVLKELDHQLREESGDEDSCFYDLDDIGKMATIYNLDDIGKMATIVQHLRNTMGDRYFFWVGFYRVTSPRLLQVGPYQGTKGCLFIPFKNGVCGAAARLEKTIIVPDVNKFVPPDGIGTHIACDSASKSEIVVPIFRFGKTKSGKRNLIAVLDVDSSEFNAFNRVDKYYLEKLVNKYF